MNEKEMECPECHYVFYKWYKDTGTLAEDGIPIYTATEVPIVIKSVFGWLCRLCRHEWREDGTPVDPEQVKRHALKMRRAGKESYAKMRGIPLELTPREYKLREMRALKEGFMPR